MEKLNGRNRKKVRKKRVIICGFIMILGQPLILYLSYTLIQGILNQFNLVKISFNFHTVLEFICKDPNMLKTCGLLNCILLSILIYFLTGYHIQDNNVDVMTVAGITIPKPVGAGQFGTNRFLNQKEIKEEFGYVQYSGKENFNKNIGVVLGMEKQKKKERLFCNLEDCNTILIGTTRSGKTRRSILQTIWVKGRSESSMVISDPKGELYLYTNQYLKDKGFDVIAFDMQQPKLSMRYNFLQSVIDAYIAGDVPRAIDSTWNIVSQLVGVPKGEPLWTNGEASVIAAAILAVVFEAPPECKNVANVYYFIANMCKEDEEGNMLATTYFNRFSDNHPAKTVFAVAELSPDKMRGSFFGSALTTLRLFTDFNIADIVSQSEFSLEAIGLHKTAIFIISRPDNAAFNSIVSLFVNQIYIALFRCANQHGLRLPFTVDFILDEFGNFPTIPEFGTMVSVGAGLGIRFILALQSYQQLEKHYKADFENIKNNCQLTIYLRATEIKTLEEISKRTGHYTVQINNVSSSVSGTGSRVNANYSSGSGMQSRTLLMPEEVGRIEEPYSLILYRKFPAILNSPDISMFQANLEFGMGDKEHNNKLLVERQKQRKIHEIEELKLWGIWNELKQKIEFNESDVEPISFLKL